MYGVRMFISIKEAPYICQITSASLRSNFNKRINYNRR